MTDFADRAAQQIAKNVENAVVKLLDQTEITSQSDPPLVDEQTTTLMAAIIRTEAAKLTDALEDCRKAIAFYDMCVRDPSAKDTGAFKDAHEWIMRACREAAQTMKEMAGD